MKKILLTGVTGFVGSELLVQLLKHSNYQIVSASRSANPILENCCQVFTLGSFNSNTSWHEALAGVDCVIHTAGRAHVLKKESNALELFKESNTEATLNLARQAEALGIKRFIFISSIGVNGACTPDQPFSELSQPAPHTEYAISKMNAELGLVQIAEQSEMEVVIIRPPLIYAGHAPGNFRRLLKLVKSGLPLPFARINNSRSMIALENFIDFICRCIDHPTAANQTFLVSDDQSFSTKELVTLLAKGMGRKIPMVSVSPVYLKGLAKLLGRQGLHTQLCESLKIDASKSKDLLGWTPPVSAETALVNAGKNYLAIAAKKKQ
ncbi:NAD-dependent epimerase/dehydratase family protein [Pseudomonas sp. MAFF 311095]|uniref:NAD-dependent epimerase/dehydratase family protein n=1 Tax=Pseudomonas petroselini TaxID=2899822 RepID=UPI0020B1B287|nr:NAD-dependent epimerase/dehydratase family protein [Pseudomonas petroselini]MCD7079633.1 NAD-dependent epimerase/dehydratase family protein [Pseudomonas petroselini]